MFGTRKLGKTSTQRKALLRQQVTDLLENGKMETTFYRAKEVQPVVEKMITLGKKGDLAAYRRALAFITKEDVAHKLFKEIAPKYADRNGGYTRVTRTGARRGDAAEMAIIELVYSGNKKSNRRSGNAAPLFLKKFKIILDKSTIVRYNIRVVADMLL